MAEKKPQKLSTRPRNAPSCSPSTEGVDGDSPGTPTPAAVSTKLGSDSLSNHALGAEQPRVISSAQNPSGFILPLGAEPNPAVPLTPPNTAQTVAINPRLTASIPTAGYAKAGNQRTRSASEESHVRSFERHRVFRNRVIMSSDDDAGRGSDSDVSAYEPQRNEKPNKPVAKRLPTAPASYRSTEATRSTSKSKASKKRIEKPRSKTVPRSRRPIILSSSSTFLRLPIPASKDKISHADEKLIKARKEGRGWHDCAIMYTRITKLAPIADDDIDDRYCRIMSRISPFTVEEDNAIGELKVAVENAFENQKWVSVAKAWSHRFGKEAGHRTLRHRFYYLGQQGEQEDAEVLTGDVVDAVEQGMEVMQDGSDVEVDVDDDVAAAFSGDDEAMQDVEQDVKQDESEHSYAGSANKKAKLSAGRIREIHHPKIAHSTPAGKQQNGGSSYPTLRKVSKTAGAEKA